MIETVFRFIASNNTLMFFLIIALGYLVGKVGFRGQQLGAIAGVLFVGLVVGHRS